MVVVEATRLLSAFSRVALAVGSVDQKMALRSPLLEELKPARSHHGNNKEPDCFWSFQ